MPSRATPQQIDRAKRLLAHEGASGNAEACALAAARVHDAIRAHLAPLVGDAGVQQLLVRSATLTRAEFAFLEPGVVETSTKLRECLQAQAPEVALGSAVALYGTFFTLIITFIGERLTTQVLSRAWPSIERTPHQEPRK